MYFEAMYLNGSGDHHTTIAGSPPGWVDCLAHLDDPRVVDPCSAVLQRAVAAGVTAVISAGVDPRCVGHLLAAAGVTLRRAYGLHPQAIDAAAWREQLMILEQRLEQRLAAPDVCALGELGLDARAGLPDADLQERVFERQLAMAHARGLPVILHAVRRHGRLLEILRAHGPLSAGGMLHGYTGSMQMAQRFVEFGMHVSFGGLVTDPRASRTRQSAASVPEDRLLLESDAPDHPPMGWSLPTSEPASVVVTAATVATLRGQTAQHVLETTARNARRLFRLA